MVTKNKNKQPLVPELRFPKFSGNNNWEERPLGDFLNEHKVKSDGQCEVHSVSVHKGVINQKEHLGRSFAAKDTSNYNLAHPNDVIYTKSPTGDFAFGNVKQSHLEIKVIVSPLYGVFTPITPEAGYIIHCFFESPQRAFKYLDPITQKGAKNTIQITNQGFLSGMVRFPHSPAEQKKIADCLGSLGDLLAAHCRKLDALQDHKKGLLQQLFPAEGETTPALRFPEFKDTGEWKVGSVDDLASILMGNAFKSTDFADCGIQLIRMGNLYQGTLKLERSPAFLPSFFAQTHSSFVLEPADLLMSMTGTVGKKDYGFVVQIPNDSGKLLLNQRVIKITPKRNFIKEFLLQLFQSENFLDSLYASAGGTKQANLSAVKLKLLKISHPKPAEQQKIADCLSDLDATITAESEQIAALKKHKKGLMQQLFPNPDSSKA